MKRAAFIVVVVLVVCGAGIALLLRRGSSGKDSRSTSRETQRTVEVAVLQVVQPEGEAWEEFEGVLICAVVDPKMSGLMQGEQLNVVAIRPEAARDGAFVHGGGKLPIEAGKRYTISVGTELPEGWESINRDFDDLRIGLLALLAIEEAD